MAGGEGVGRGIAGLKNVRTGGGFPIWGGGFLLGGQHSNGCYDTLGIHRANIELFILCS